MMDGQRAGWLWAAIGTAVALWLLDSASKPAAGSVSTGAISNVSGTVTVAGQITNGLGGVLAVPPPETCGCTAIPRY